MTDMIQFELGTRNKNLGMFHIHNNKQKRLKAVRKHTFATVSSDPNLHWTRVEEGALSISSEPDREG